MLNTNTADLTYNIHKIIIFKDAVIYFQGPTQLISFRTCNLLENINDPGPLHIQNMKIEKKTWSLKEDRRIIHDWFMANEEAGRI